MDHRYFEEILLNDEPFAREENAALQAHLRVCPTCAALAQANLALHTVVMAAPAAGFASRFQARLVAQRKAQRKRYLFGGLILLFSAIGVGIWLALPILSVALFSPTTLLVSWANTLASTVSFFQALFETGDVILRVAVGFIPAEAWVFSLSLFSLLSIVLMISVQKNYPLAGSLRSFYEK